MVLARPSSKMLAMEKLAPALRFLAIVMVVVVIGTVTAPAPAHADVLAVVGIATLVVVGVIIVVYLIAANAADRRTSDAEIGTLVVAAAPTATEAP